jgi:hypothetical protein
MKRSLAWDLPPDCVIISAQLIRVGDRVRFRWPSADYTVEMAETGPGGLIHHHANDGTAIMVYHPGELLWITRRATDPVPNPRNWIVVEEHIDGRDLCGTVIRSGLTERGAKRVAAAYKRSASGNYYHYHATRMKEF